MAKKSWIERNKKRELLAEKYAAKRLAYKKIIATGTPEEAWQARMALQSLPRNSSPTRIVTRCAITGRSRGVYSKFKLSRSILRKLANEGMLPGLTIASW